MSQKKEILEFIVPNWALCPLINGDFSGTEDEDEIKINKFCEDTVKKYGHAHFALPNDNDLDQGFRYSNDIDKLGSDCSKLLLLVDPNFKPAI